MKPRSLTSGVVVVLASFALSGCGDGSDTGGYVPNDQGYLVNTDDQNVILGGYDAVAYFAETMPVIGSEDFQSVHEGAIYRFSSQDDLEAFERDPLQYRVDFGGFCSMAVAHGMLEPADPTIFEIFNRRLVIQRNEKAARLWKKDPEGNPSKADETWPRLVEKARQSPS